MQAPANEAAHHLKIKQCTDSCVNVLVYKMDLKRLIPVNIIKAQTISVKGGDLNRINNSAVRCAIHQSAASFV